MRQEVVMKLSLIQMRVVGGERQANLERAERLVGKAASQGASVVLLPEAMDLGWTHPSAAADATPIPGGETCSRLREAARKQSVYLCSGLVERAGDRVFNTAVLFSPAGDILLHHRKINELEIAH